MCKSTSCLLVLALVGQICHQVNGELFAYSFSDSCYTDNICFVFYAHIQGNRQRCFKSFVYIFHYGYSVGYNSSRYLVLMQLQLISLPLVAGFQCNDPINYLYQLLVQFCAFSTLILMVMYFFQGPEMVRVSKFYKEAKNGRYLRYLHEDTRTLYETFRRGVKESSEF